MVFDCAPLLIGKRGERDSQFVISKRHYITHSV